MADEIRWLEDSVVEKARKAVVAVRIADGSSITGFFASRDGLVVTSAVHLEGANSVEILTGGLKRINGARLMAIDDSHDLAVFATDRSGDDFLELDMRPAKVGEACVVVYYGGASGFKANDGGLLARRSQPLRTEARLPELWSVGLNSKADIPPGAPVITSNGKAAGMYDVAGNTWGQKFFWAVPEAVIASLLERARSSRKPIPFPTRGQISGSGMPIGHEFAEGTVLESSGNAEGAAEKMRVALKKNPGNQLVMTHLAANVLAVGDFAGAREILEKARHLGFGNRSIQTAIARIDFVQGHFEKRADMMNQGLQALRQLSTSDPADAEALLVFGWALGMVDAGSAEALAISMQAVELQPESKAAWEALGKALQAAGKHDEAIKASDHVADLDSLFFKLKYVAPRR